MSACIRRSIAGRGGLHARDVAHALYSARMRNPFELTASELAAAIRDRQLGASDVLEAHLERIAQVNPSLEQAARLLGAGPVRTFFTITFPLALPGMLAGCLLTFALSAGAFVTPNFLGGGKVPLVAPEMVLAVRERVDCFGKVVRPLDEAHFLDGLRTLVDRGARGFVVSLLFSYVNPVHERRIRGLIEAEFPEAYLGAMPIMLSSEVMPKRNRCRPRVSHSEARRPTPTPAPAIVIDCRSTSPTMSVIFAPSAERTPISRERWATLYESTPKRPTPAIASANAANVVSSTA